MRNAILALLILAAGVPAQTFEVATVKPATPPEPGKPMMMGIRGGPGSADPGQISANVTLSMLLMNAYDVKAYQITGPPWLNMERYEVIAKIPPGATKDQVRVMWQNLLADRFGLTLHHQSKVFQVEEMQIAKAGKLKETTLGANPPDAPPPAAGLPFTPPKMDKNGVPELSAPGLIMMMTMGPTGPSAHMVGKAQTTAQLAGMVGNELDRPVVDKTGLTGKYDFVLEFAPDPSRMRLPPGAPSPPPGSDANPTDPTGLTIVGALQQQLGLRLASTKAPLDTLVIDHAEKVPTEN